jgi:excinuclease ABC subunit C
VWVEAPIDLKSLPKEPGIYRMLDAKRQVLYVGKARNLSKRVASYFQRMPDSPRIQAMVVLVRDIECNITPSEADALILEHNLIKQLKPRYNVLLKDSKSYPYIVLTDEAFPRLQQHRGARKRAGEYFGPYPHGQAVKETLHILHSLFQLRDCDDSEFANRSRPCMQHQIGRCSAPCCGVTSQTDYLAQIQSLRMVLQGQDDAVLQAWEQEMQQASARMAFERAALLRDRIRDLRRIMGGVRDSGLPDDADAVVIVRKPESVLLAIGVRRGGRDLGTHTVTAKQAEAAEDDEVLHTLMLERYRKEPPPADIYIQQEPTVLASLKRMLQLLHPSRKLTLSHPRRGNRVEWLAQVRKSAVEQVAHRSLDQRPAFAALADVLQLDAVPQRIAAVDNAHLGGQHMVAAIVYGGWQGAEKDAYRRYRLDDVPAADDYAAMAAVLTRFYTAMAEGRIPVPDIMIIDGGKGQLSVAESVARGFPQVTLRLLGMAKGETRKVGDEELWPAWAMDAPLPLKPGRHSSALLLLARVRDEAHRFAGEYMRMRKKKQMFQSDLDGIAGIGKEKRLRLLKHFGGIKGVKEASRQQLAQAPGISVVLAERIFAALHT